MNEKEYQEFMAILIKQGERVRKSKKAARELLDSLGMLTPTGKLKRKFIPPKVTPANSPTTHKWVSF